MTELLEFLRQLFTDPFGLLDIPVREWVTDAVNWIVRTFRDFFRSYISPPVRGVMELFQWALSSVPPLVFLALAYVIAWRAASWRVAVFTVIAFAFIGFMGVWDQMIITLSLIASAVFFCILIGLPIGILC